MTTAVDTNVLLDVFLPDEIHGPRSLEWLRNAYDRGAILVCDVVYAELVPAFGDRATHLKRRCGRSARPSLPSIPLSLTKLGCAGYATAKPAGHGTVLSLTS